MVQVLWKTVYQLFINLTVHLLYNLEILLGVYPET